MIPRAAITAWRATVPWSQDAHVEQDLVISRALVDIYSDSVLSGNFAFRGGTALHKLCLASAYRYSEDIDLVQIKAGNIGPLLTRIRTQLNWLGKAESERKERSVKLVYKFYSENEPVQKMKLKIEINTREHGSYLPLCNKEHVVSSSWYSGKADVVTYETDELLATKLRALYQRKKGRDLFDLYMAMQGCSSGGVDAARVVGLFLKYIDAQQVSITREAFIGNLDDKLKDAAFCNDIRPIILQNTDYDVQRAADVIKQNLLMLL